MYKTTVETRIKVKWFVIFEIWYYYITKPCLLLLKNEILVIFLKICHVNKEFNGELFFSEYSWH